MKDRSVFKAVDWHGISPRGYVFSVDFTFSSQNGVRVLEFNGPTYPYGTADFKNLAKSRFTWNVFYVLNWIGASGYQGHDELFYPLTVDDLIEKSSQSFAARAGWNLETVKVLKPKPWSQDNLARTALLVLDNATDTTARRDLLPYGLILNDAHHTNFVRFKPLLRLLPEVKGVTVPSTAFTSDTKENLQGYLRSFLNANTGELFILKPADQARSEGVMLRRRAELMNLNKELRDELKSHKTWVLQPYMPSDPTCDLSGSIRSPVGRAFYQIIFDGQNVHIAPLTVYRKLGGARLDSPEDIFDPAKVTFGPSESGQEYTQSDLSVIVAELNRYLDSVAGPMFQLSENGLLGEYPLAHEVRERFKALPSSEKRAIRQTVKPYTSIIRVNKDLMDWSRLRSRILGVELIESNLYRSLRTCAAALEE